MNKMSYKNSTKPILITGETGTGKSQLARELHKCSAFRNEPFVKVNLSSIPDSLFESELFGHVKGSFTGAVANKMGLLASGGEGTVFLDEIGELSLIKQIKLLHILDDGEYYPVGSSRVQKFNGRFVFATNKNLSELISAGKFREDLYYRIRYCQVDLKPLREKCAKELESEIINIFNKLQLRDNKFNCKYDYDLISQLVGYNWPGNYRELQNTLEYLHSLEVGKLRAKDLPSWIVTSDDPSEKVLSSGKSYYREMELFEREFFKKALNRYSGQINKTALEIGLSKVTLISKLKRYDIDRRDYKYRGEAVGF